MDQGLKERLVGAAVLVAIGVWLIPWVLDGPESPLDSSASSLQLPAAEEPMPMRTQTLRLGEPAAEAPSESRPAAAPVQAPVAASNESAAPAHQAAAEHTGAAGAHATADTPAPTPRVATAPPPQRTASSAAAAPSGDWIVQLGSFGEEANARRLAQRSGALGHAAEVASYSTDGRTLYRVRVGPATTRAQADAKASALRAHGIEARVVAAR